MRHILLKMMMPYSTACHVQMMSSWFLLATSGTCHYSSIDPAPVMCLSYGLCLTRRPVQCDSAAPFFRSLPLLVNVDVRLRAMTGSRQWPTVLEVDVAS
jgi:hypothetical protein